MKVNRKKSIRAVALAASAGADAALLAAGLAAPASASTPPELVICNTSNYVVDAWVNTSNVPVGVSDFLSRTVPGTQCGTYNVASIVSPLTGPEIVRINFFIEGQGILIGALSYNMDNTTFVTVSGTAANPLFFVG